MADNPFTMISNINNDERTFDQSYKLSDIDAFNQQKKTQDFSLNIQLQEPVQEDNTFDYMEHFDVNQAKEFKPVQVVQQRYTNTLADPNTFAQLNYNETQPILVGANNGKLINQQKMGGMSRVQKMEDHQIMEAGRDTQTEMQIKAVNSNLQHAGMHAKQMMTNLELKVPKPEDPEYARNVEPDRHLIRQQQDLDNQKIYQTATYYNSQVGDNDPRRRALLVPKTGLQAQQIQTKAYVAPAPKISRQGNKLGGIVNTRANGTAQNNPIIRNFNLQKFVQIQRRSNDFVVPNTQTRIDRIGGQTTQSLQSNITIDDNKYINYEFNMQPSIKHREIGPTAQVSQENRNRMRNYNFTRITSTRGDQAVYNNTDMLVPKQNTFFNSIISQTSVDANHGAVPVESIIQGMGY